MAFLPAAGVRASRWSGRTHRDLDQRPVAFVSQAGEGGEPITVGRLKHRSRLGTTVGTVGLALITTVAFIREGKERRELKAERDAARQRNEALEREKVERAERDAAEAANRTRRVYADAVYLLHGLGGV